MDNRATTELYVRKRWSARVTYIPGNPNIKEVPLVDLKNVSMPPRRIKLGLMKNFVKQLEKSKSNGFAFFCNKYLNTSKAKLKEGIFVGLSIQDVWKIKNLKKS